ncbi:MAG TPA: DNA primase, partial [Thermomicrobiales bacterium]|nr:DNA primase [Thermomicrobiales bacterium]
EIRDRIDIVDLVTGYVPSLKRTGRSFKGLCPFHQEKTPSFIVFPDSQNFHCFGCGKGGDIFTFYMGVENVEFREALQELAKRAGVTLTSGPAPVPELDAHRQRLVEINELAGTFYQNILRNSRQGEAGREMARQRELSTEMVVAFGLGFAPDSWDSLLTFMASRDIPAELVAEAGLASERDSGGYYDRFRNRFMFPIRDRDGHTVGFGGRAMGDAKPKYLNSPQSAIFDKSSLVYGLDLAKDAIRKADEVVIVEGYMDVIAAHQFGYANVVGAMGTALTESQVGLIKRGSKRIVLALDADAAGQMATMRGLETMRDSLDSEEQPVPDAMGIIRFERKLNTEIAIVQLPEGKDPDELIRRRPEQWPEIVRNAKPFMDFAIDTLTQDLSLDDARAKSEAVKRIAPLLHGIPDRIVQGHYIGLLSRRLMLDERLVLAEVRRSTMSGRPSASRRTVAEPVPEQQRPRSKEDFLVALLLKHHQLTFDIATRIPLEDIIDVRNRELIRVLSDPALMDLTAEQLVVGLDDDLADHAENLLTMLEGRPEAFPGNIQTEASQVLENIGKERFMFLFRQLQASLQEATREQDSDQVDLVRHQIAQLSQRHQLFYPAPSPYFKDSRTPQR